MAADDPLNASIRIEDFLDEVAAVAESEIVHRDDECDPADCTPHTALRLTAALRAVLRLAAEAHPSGYRYSTTPTLWNLDPVAVRATIAANLLGEAGDD